MDGEYQRRLIADEFAQLQKRVREEGWRDVQAKLVGGIVFARLLGAAGASEPYLAKIEPANYPIGPWRLGFIDPSAKGETRLWIPDRDPRYWPYSPLPGRDGGFHIAYPGVYRVFYCKPCTTEYFLYHSDDTWRPDIYDLPRVVAELRQDVRRAMHPSRWIPMFRVGVA